MSTTSEYNIENINRCGSENNNSGLKTRLYYAPVSFFTRITLPESTSYEESLVIKEGNIAFREDMSWSYIDVLINENELNLSLLGPVRKKKQESSLSIYILGFSARNIGFIEKHLNTPMVYMIPDANGNNWLLGNLRNPALFDNINGASGKKYEDNSGINLTIKAKSSLYRYAGAIGLIDETPVVMSRAYRFYDITHL